MSVSDPYEFDALAKFNSEVARGIVHTPEWVEKMRLEQERFNAEQETEWLARGAMRVGESLWMDVPYGKPSRWRKWRGIFS